MTDKVQKIRKRVVEIVSSINPFIPDEDGKNSDYEAGKLDAATQILQIIDSLKDPVSEDLEEAGKQYLERSNPDRVHQITNAFKAGAKWQKQKDFQYVKKECEKTGSCCDNDIAIEAAKRHPYYYASEMEAYTNIGFKEGAMWQKEQFEKNRLKHCNSITNEQAELEQGFIDQHLDKYNRMPTFLDAIEYGMKLKEQQLLKGTVEREVKQDAGGYPHIDATELYDYDKGIPLAKAGDKVKVVIIKED